MNALVDSSDILKQQGLQRRAERDARNDAIEANIISLAGEINAAEYRFLTLLREFDDVEGWAGDGIKSFAHWLNYKIGLSEVVAREKVRVARALADLPQINEAFRLGKISYSKVRAMTRVATPENEAFLVSVAKYGTAGHMERLTRQYRRVQRLNETDGADIWRQERGFRYHTDEDGMVVFHGRFPAEEGAVIVKALEVMCESLRRERGNAAREAAARAKNQPGHGGAEIEQGLAARRRVDPHTVDFSQVPYRGTVAQSEHEIGEDEGRAEGRQNVSTETSERLLERDGIETSLKNVSAETSAPAPERDGLETSLRNVSAETFERVPERDGLKTSLRNVSAGTSEEVPAQDALEAELKNVSAETFERAVEQVASESRPKNVSAETSREVPSHATPDTKNVSAESFSPEIDHCADSSFDDDEHHTRSAPVGNESERMKSHLQEVPVNPPENVSPETSGRVPLLALLDANPTNVSAETILHEVDHCASSTLNDDEHCIRSAPVGNDSAPVKSDLQEVSLDPPENFSAETFSTDELPDILSDQATALTRMAEQYLEQVNEAGSGSGFSEKFQVMLHINANEAHPDHQFTGESPCHLEDGHFLSHDVARQLCCDAHRRIALVDDHGDVLSIGRRSRTIPTTMRHALAIRDNGCRFPGCCQTRWTDAHHIIHWADGGETSLANLVTLCRRHHRLIHQGEYRIEKTERDFIFVNARDEQIPQAIHPQFKPVEADERVAALRNDQRDLNIDRTTAETLWQGETMDYSMAIHVLAIADEDRGSEADTDTNQNECRSRGQA